MKNTDQQIAIQFWAWIKTKKNDKWWISHKDMIVKDIVKEWKKETGVNCNKHV